MVEEGQGWSWSLLHRGVSAVATLLAVIIATAGGVSARAAEPARAIRLSEAAELGTFNVGPARAAVRRVPDPAAGGEVLTLDYTIPRGAAAGLYAKAFPGGLDADRVDVVRLAVKADDAGPGSTSRRGGRDQGRGGRAADPPRRSIPNGPRSKCSWTGRRSGR